MTKKKITEDQIKECLPYLREAYQHLFKLWESINKIESACDIEIETQSLMDSCISVCDESELTDEVLRSFFKTVTV